MFMHSSADVTKQSYIETHSSSIKNFFYFSTVKLAPAVRFICPTIIFSAVLILSIFPPAYLLCLCQAYILRNTSIIIA